MLLAVIASPQFMALALACRSGLLSLPSFPCPIRRRAVGGHGLFAGALLVGLIFRYVCVVFPGFAVVFWCFAVLGLLLCPPRSVLPPSPSLASVPAFTPPPSSLAPRCPGFSCGSALCYLSHPSLLGSRGLPSSGLHGPALTARPFTSRTPARKVALSGT